MSLLEINFEMPAWNAKLRRALPELYLTLAAAMQTNRGELFDAEGAANGHEGWAPLKFRQGQILSMRGNLRKSIAPQGRSGRPGPGGIVKMGDGIVTIGTDLIYAKLMNDGTAMLPGGVLKPVNAKALKIPLPAGKRATPLAQELRKSATSGKSILARQNEIKQDIETTKNPARRAKLREILAKMEKKNQGVKASDKFMFLASVKIPARPFDTITVEDAKEIEETLMNKIFEVLSQ